MMKNFFIQQEENKILINSLKNEITQLKEEIISLKNENNLEDMF
jgi:hypothetical protein